MFSGDYYAEKSPIEKQLITKTTRLLLVLLSAYSDTLAQALMLTNLSQTTRRI